MGSGRQSLNRPADRLRFMGDIRVQYGAMAFVGDAQEILSSPLCTRLIMLAIVAGDTVQILRLSNSNSLSGSDVRNVKVPPAECIRSSERYRPGIQQQQQ